MGKIEKIKLWFIDMTNYQVSTNDAQKLLDLLEYEDPSEDEDPPEWYGGD